MARHMQMKHIDTPQQSEGQLVHAQAMRGDAGHGCLCRAGMWAHRREAGSGARCGGGACAGRHALFAAARRPCLRHDDDGGLLSSRCKCTCMPRWSLLVACSAEQGQELQPLQRAALQSTPTWAQRGRWHWQPAEERRTARSRLASQPSRQISVPLLCMTHPAPAQASCAGRALARVAGRPPPRHCGAGQQKGWQARPPLCHPPGQALQID